MKDLLHLAILIPAHNEEKTIGEVIQSLPRTLPNIADIKYVVVNDGSSDQTFKVAREAGANYIVNHSVKKGLASAIGSGIAKCLEIGADIILTIDADNQYDSAEIPLLLGPILDNGADLVLGDRQIDNLTHMTSRKKRGNKIVSRLVSYLCKQKINDTQTGFRALTKECALRTNIMSDYTYTQEMILQAAHNKMKIVEVPITFRKREDKSRLIKNIFSYAFRVSVTIIRTLTFHMPVKTYGYLSAIILIIGGIIVTRPLLNYIDTGGISPFLPSLIVSMVFFIVGIQTAVFALMSEMNKNNNKTLADILYLLKKQTYNIEHDEELRNRF